MHKTLKDSRLINRLDPDALMEQIATATIAIAKANARFEAKVKTLKDAYEAEVAGDREARAEAERQLCAWIDANPDAFQRPKSRSNAYGKYGLRSVSNLRILNAELLLAELEARGYEDCIKRVVEPIKPAVRKRLTDGEALPGTEIEVGERAYCEVSKTLVEKALEDN